jgi:hypothetical protein
MCVAATTGKMGGESKNVEATASGASNHTSTDGDRNGVDGKGFGVKKTSRGVWGGRRVGGSWPDGEAEQPSHRRLQGATRPLPTCRHVVEQPSTTPMRPQGTITIYARLLLRRVDRGKQIVLEIIHDRNLQVIFNKPFF